MAAAMTRILGVDPGSRTTGYGIIDMVGSRMQYNDSGCIHTSSEQPLPERLKIIFQSLNDVIAAYRPEEMAVEQVFMHRNPDSALKLGQARESPSAPACWRRCRSANMPRGSSSRP